jgi:hypothetical protein
MSENIRQFIDQLAAGQNAEAKDTLENDLAARSFAALDEYKKQIAQSIFGGSQEEELTMEESEQLDEVSLKTASKAYAGRWKQNWGPDAKEDEPNKKPSIDKLMDTGERIEKKFGKKGETRVKRLNWALGTKHPEDSGGGFKGTEHGSYWKNKK